MTAGGDAASKHGQSIGSSRQQQLEPLSCARLVALVRDRATPEELGAWLKVPLEHAAAVGDRDLTAQLMQAGASGDPLTAAIKGGHHDLVQDLLLVHGGEICRAGENIRLAARLGHAPIVSLLLMNGADVNQRASGEADDSDFLSALDLAAIEGHVEVIAEIAGHGKRQGVEVVNATAEVTGRSALHQAARCNQEGSIDALVEAGAQLELEAQAGYTPLHLAATFGSDAAIRALLRHGADIERVTIDDLSPVILAIKEGHQTAMITLMAAGANVNPRDGSESGLEHALQAAAGAETNAEDAELEDTMRRRIGLVRTLLLHGACASAASDLGFTPLHWAGWFGFASVVDMLVEAGADVEATLRHGGDTPLHGASTNAGNVDAINALVRHGANLHARKTPCGNTPLHMAANNCVFEQAPATVDALLKAGADENILNAAGQTPLQLVAIVDDTYESYPEIEQVRSLLMNAPQDRAYRVWRRRALFVLCRAFPDRMRLACPDSGGGDEWSQSPATVGDPAAHPATIPWKRKCTGGFTGGTNEKKTSSLHDGPTCGFSMAMGRLIGLQEDCIFREIMRFL